MQEEKLSCQREISWVVLDHDIPLDLVHILDQNPLSYVSPGKCTICLKGSITFLIKGVDNKRYVSAKFTVSDTCVVPVHLIIEVQQKDVYQYTNSQRILTFLVLRTTGRFLRKMRRFVSKDYIPISTTKKVKI